MGRELKRVPMDFDWPIGERWFGYTIYVNHPDCPDCVEKSPRCGTCWNVRTEALGYSPDAKRIQNGLRDGSISWPEGVEQYDTWRASVAVAESEGLSRDDLSCSRCGGHGHITTPELEAWEELRPRIDPPIGDGYQLWETTSEGSPASPVFATLDELCDYAAENCTTFASFKATAEEWRSMLDRNFVTTEIAPGVIAL